MYVELLKQQIGAAKNDGMLFNCNQRRVMGFVHIFTAGVIVVQFIS